MIRAAEVAGIAALVRVPGVDPGAIQRALDAGALGIVVPRVSDATEAQAVVAAARYQPLGQRGVTGGRTTGFGTLALADYLKQVNDETLVVLMIETCRGVENVDAIPRAPGQFEHWREQGIDAFLLGEDRGILFRRLREYRNAFACQGHWPGRYF
jgi:4-hydroxy-2-oxoheptanedioate aldolase